MSDKALEDILDEILTRIALIEARITAIEQAQKHIESGRLGA